MSYIPFTITACYALKKDSHVAETLFPCSICPLSFRFMIYFKMVNLNDPIIQLLIKLSCSSFNRRKICLTWKNSTALNLKL